MPGQNPRVAEAILAALKIGGLRAAISAMCNREFQQDQTKGKYPAVQSLNPLSRSFLVHRCLLAEGMML
jgi:hypothetical protein